MAATENCCTVGTAATATYGPRGAMETKGGLLIYTTTPQNRDAPQGSLLLLPDAFGLATHNLILADRFANEGWHTILPDYFEGDAIPEELLKRESELEKERARNFNLPEWLGKHPHDRIETLLLTLIGCLRKENPNKPIVAAGYCFGGKHALRLSRGAIEAAALFHPSFLSAEDAHNVAAPLYIGLAEKDHMAPKTLRQDLDDWLGQTKGNYTLEVYEDVDHGFASRPDMSIQNGAKQYSRALKDAVDFFKNHV